MPRSFVLAALLSLPAVAQESAVRELVERLRSEKAEERDEATRKLCDLGNAALGELEKASRSGEAEFSQRVLFVRKVIQIRAGLSERLLRAMPNLEFRLASGNKHEWTRALLAALESDAERRPKYPTLRRSDLVGLVKPALQGAETPGEKTQLCEIVRQLQPPDVVPELRQFLRDKGDLSRGALGALASVGAREAIPDMLPFLKDERTLLRSLAAGILGEWKVREAAPALLALLSDVDDGTRLTAAMALSDLHVPELLPSVIALLKSEGRYGRVGALYAMGSMGDAESASVVVPFLKDPDDEYRL